jgi:cell surface protein SprA
LGEAQLSGLADNEVVVLDPIPASPPFFYGRAGYSSDNKNNAYNPELIQAGGGLLNPNIREIVTANSGFNVTVSEGQDYSKLENARKLNPNEYTFSPQLGYISLQQRLANDEVLAVAYQYTIGDQVYQVGEFGNDGVDATVVTGNTPATQAIISQSLILKMLKSNLTNVKNRFGT